MLVLESGSSINDLQSKLLEVLAPSALAIASIFFAILTFLFGALLTLEKDSQKRPVKIGIYLTFPFCAASLVLSVLTMYALRFHCLTAYIWSLRGTGITLGGMLLIAILILVRTFKS